MVYSGYRDRVVSIGDIGERALLSRILERMPTGREHTLLGPGDDAAILAAPDNRTVISTDTLIEGPDFRLDWSTPQQLGHKAIVVNLADIAAMGARPTGLVVALAAPADTEVAFLESLASGMADALQRQAPDIGIVGGDLATAPQLVIAVTVFGTLDGAAPVTRSGANPGDIVAIAGAMGHAAAGLDLCFGGALQAGAPALPAAQRQLIEHQLAPNPPIDAGVTARIHGATAMLDVSDGLLLDAHRLAQASGVTLDLRPARWRDETLALAAKRGCSNEEALAFELNGGEDHALLATFPATVDDAPTSLPVPFRQIGVVQQSADAPVTVDGAAAPATGWDPYAAASTGTTSR